MIKIGDKTPNERPNKVIIALSKMMARPNTQNVIISIKRKFEICILEKLCPQINAGDY